MKITFIINSLCIGGAEKFLLNFVQALKKRNIGVTVISLFSNAALKDAFELAGTDVKMLGINKKRRIFGLKNLIKAIKKEKPDVVHTHLEDAFIYGCIASKVCGVPVIISTIHSVAWWHLAGKWRQKIRRIAKRFSAHLCTKVIAVSTHVGRDIETYGKISRDKIEIVNNGIVIDDAIENPKDKKGTQVIIATVGRLVKEKGHYYFIHAAKSIVEHNSSVQFWIIGDGYLRAELENETRKMEINKSIKFLGFRDDVKELLQKMDIFVLSSISEGLPISLLEAMSYAKPIVATRIRGITGVVMDEYNGLLVDPKNSRDIANACIRLIEHPEESKQFGLNAEKTVLEKFNIEENVDKTLRLYEDALRKRKCTCEN